MDIVTALQAPFLMCQGSIRERINREAPIRPDKNIGSANLIYLPEGREFLKRLYGSYIYPCYLEDLPMIVTAQTKFLHPERVARYDASQPDVVGDSLAFMRELCADFGEYGKKMIVGAITGSKNNAYKPEEALTEEESYRYHRPHVEALAAAGPDFINSVTMPSVEEAKGLVRLMSETGLPYIVSFVVRPTGCVLDGTPLDEAMKQIDAAVPGREPVSINVNCVHATVLDSCISHCRDQEYIKSRLHGFLCNTSALSPEELDHCEELQTEDPKVFAKNVFGIHKKYGTTWVGGCCGTDERHLIELVKLMKAEYHF